MLSIAKDYSPFVLGRYPEDSDYNGTDFREQFLLPKIKELLQNEAEVLDIDLNGSYGYDPSFLEEAFGGSIRRLRQEGFALALLKKLWSSRIKIHDDDKAEYRAIKGYIEDALHA